MQAKLDEAAARLRAAYANGPVPPLRDILEPTDGDAAYAIQLINQRHWLSEGRRIVGRKIGLTSASVQAQLGVDQPDYGTLYHDRAIEDGGDLLASKVLQPKAEAEIALVLGRDLTDPNSTSRDVQLATAAVFPAIEIVDSRILDWKITFADTVADNASSAFFVQGREARAIAGLDLWTCGMALEVNGKVRSLGAGAACLGHPLNAAAWLVRTLCQRGETLREGDILLTGALGPMVPITPGDIVRATIGGVGSCGFVFQEDRV
jgi:2-keto-4-pentenoate hydratase